MYYFAYGSNMSIARLRERVPSASRIGCHLLKKHDLRFHKSGKDGSGKCDAFFTDNDQDIIFGALFEIDPAEKPNLDRVEGRGYGYDEKEVTVIAACGAPVNAMTYIATNIDEYLQPYSWYVNHVLIGAQETALPEEYIQTMILAIDTVDDDNEERDSKERVVHG